MSGASYGGGIQLVTAALDPRVDAIVPVIAWHSLVTSLDKAGAPKSGWSNLLYLLGSTHQLDPHIASSIQAVRAGKPTSAPDVAWFASRGPGDLVGRIRAPTLLIQGTVDTLFTPQEAIDNYVALRRGGVPVKMLWFCGGHGACLTNPGDRALTARATLSWFDRYLKGGADDGAPGFRWVDQDGRAHSAPEYPPAAGRALSATGRGTLSLLATGGSGPAHAPGGDLVATAAATVAAAKASNAVNVKIPTPAAGRLVVGAPTLKLTYRGRAAARHVLAQLVDDATGKVLGNQITPIPVRLDGATHTVSRPLEPIAASTHAGSSFTLQLVAQSTAYDLRPKGGKVAFRKVSVSLPVSAAR
jgi:ABC-2 type transport system ATP-binding protein